MASVSVSHLVLFIASLLIASMVAGTLVTGVDRVSSSMSEQSLETSESIRTDIDIISDPGSDAVVDGGDVVALVKNTGSKNLAAREDSIDVLLNGRYVPAEDLVVEELDDDGWKPGDVIRVTIDADANSDLQVQDSNRLTVIVDGNEALMRFRN
ncbi:MAG: hypothetical protein ACOCQ3_02915 [Natronomonas sp.]